jgi:hypothetical protein
MVKVTRKVSEKYEKTVSEEITPSEKPSHRIVGTGTKIPKDKGIVIRKRKF